MALVFLHHSSSSSSRWGGRRRENLLRRIGGVINLKLTILSNNNRTNSVSNGVVLQIQTLLQRRGVQGDRGSAAWKTQLKKSSPSQRGKEGHSIENTVTRMGHLTSDPNHLYGVMQKGLKRWQN